MSAGLILIAIGGALMGASLSCLIYVIGKGIR